MEQHYNDNSLILTREKAGEPVLKIDKTFATRFATFMGYLVNKYGAGDFLIDQDGWYLKSVAEDMLRLQRMSVYSVEEEQYFKNIDH